jgi:NtrC-family two-component system response regulator AlgB
VVEFVVPPLRDRPEDIVLLTERFLAFFAAKAKRPTLSLSPAASAALQQYAWPGNVRELRNTIERLVILWPAQVVEQAALPERMRVVASHDSVALGGDFTLEQIEHEHLIRVLARTRTADDAAKILGIDASTLWRKRKKLES